MKWKLFSIIVGLGLIASGLWWWKNQTPDPGAEFGLVPMTAAKLPGVIKDAGTPLVLVNFWATWCVPCKAEMPGLVRLQKKYASDFKVIFVTLDDKEAFPGTTEFLIQTGVQFPTYYSGSGDLVKEVYSKSHGALPTSIIFGRDGKMIEAWEGDITEADLEAKITTQLRGT